MKVVVGQRSSVPSPPEPQRETRWGENYLKKYVDIEKVDGEHYSTNVHKAIAQRYIPYIKETQ